MPAIDLRSDTVTRPTAAMKAAMFDAPLGDDVWGEDPTVSALEHTVAARFGREAALFCPSGTMTNQLAVVVHTRPGEDLILARDSHVYQYEAGGYAFHAGLAVSPLDGDRGRLTAEAVAAAVHPDDPHKPPSRLVVIENTANRGGGAVYDLDEALRIRAVCREHGLALHLDGARLFNALVATGQDERSWGATVDSISLCLSKGLGCPVGSVLIGDRAFIDAARRMRKRFGGGMRQAGLLAAAGLYALEHHVERLAEDHRRARRLGEALAARPWCAELLPVETNIAIARVTPDRPVAAMLAALESGGVLAAGMGGDLLRLVTHLDVDDDAVDYAAELIGRIP